MVRLNQELTLKMKMANVKMMEITSVEEEEVDEVVSVAVEVEGEVIIIMIWCVIIVKEQVILVEIVLKKVIMMKMLIEMIIEVDLEAEVAVVVEEGAVVEEAEEARVTMIKEKDNSLFLHSITKLKRNINNLENHSILTRNLFLETR